MLQYFQDLPDWIRYIITASVVVISIVHYLLWIHRPKKHLETSELAVVITGCDTGFGNLLAKELHSLGFKVVATFLTEEGMKSLQNHVDLALKCDVTIDSDIEKLYKATDEFLNTKNLKLWAVVNNAGVGMGGYLDWLSLARFKFIMEVNFFGVLKVTKAMLPLLKRTKESRIITLSSVAGVIGGPGFGGYSASKHALEGAMKCFRIELRPWNIHVCNINPAYMNTPIIANSEQSRLRIFKEAPVEVQNQYDMNVKLTPPVGEVSHFYRYLFQSFESLHIL